MAIVNAQEGDHWKCSVSPVYQGEFSTCDFMVGDPDGISAGVDFSALVSIEGILDDSFGNAYVELPIGYDDNREDVTLRYGTSPNLPLAPGVWWDFMVRLDRATLSYSVQAKHSDGTGGDFLQGGTVLGFNSSIGVRTCVSIDDSFGSCTNPLGTVLVRGVGVLGGTTRILPKQIDVAPLELFDFCDVTPATMRRASDWIGRVERVVARHVDSV